jgi:release factor glutamine methyltransferase
LAESWTVLKLLQWTEGYLKERGIEEARLDAQLLLSDVLKLDRVGLYLNYDRPLDGPELGVFREMVKRRARREPVQYILGKTEFWSLFFKVTPAVLIPRGDTEVLVEESLQRASGAKTVLDVGTGSGAIAVALAKELPVARVEAIDISPEALEIAMQNARENGVGERIAFERRDLADLPEGAWDLIVSNPPYIPHGDLATLMPEVRDFEPQGALDGGPDGLAPYRHLARQSREKLSPGGWLLVEVGIGQAEAVQKLFSEHGLTGVFSRPDYAGIPRVVGGRKH